MSAPQEPKSLASRLADRFRLKATPTMPHPYLASAFVTVVFANSVMNLARPDRFAPGPEADNSRAVQRNGPAVHLHDSERRSGAVSEGDGLVLRIVADDGRVTDFPVDQFFMLPPAGDHMTMK